MAGRPKQASSHEIALIERTNRYEAFTPYLQPGDKILRAKGGGNLDIYRDILRDWQVHSTFQQRRLAVVSRETIVEAASKDRADQMAADWLREQIEGLSVWDKASEKMLFGLYYGWSVAELLYGYDGRYVVIEDIKVRRRDNFRWDRQGRLRFLTRERSDGEILPPRKFWTFSAGGEDDDDPYGLGLGHHLFWPVFFKKNDIKFWLIFLEKFGQPTVKGEYPRSATPEEQERLLEACRAVATEAGIVVPEGMPIELLEAARSGTGTYKEMAEYMDAAISKVVLSQTMTTDDGASLSQSEVHMDVRDEVVKADGDILCGSFNDGPVASSAAWNFPGARPPRVWRRVEDEPDLKPQAERDSLIYGMGYQPTPDYITETYGEGFERRPTPTLPPLFEGSRDSGDSEAFAETVELDPAAQTGFAAARAPIEQLVETLRARIKAATTFVEAKAALLELSAEAADPRLVELAREALVLAELQGMDGAASDTPESEG